MKQKQNKTSFNFAIYAELFNKIDSLNSIFKIETKDIQLESETFGKKEFSIDNF